MYRKKIEKRIRLNINYIDKNKFLIIYSSVCTAALSEKNIQSDFKATELILYDSEQVLVCLNTQIKISMLSETSYSS